MKTSQCRFSCHLFSVDTCRALMLSFIAGFFLLGNSSAAADQLSEQQKLTVDTYGKKVKNIISDIEKTTGYRVLLQSLDDSMLVNGSCEPSPVSTFFKCIFNKYNISIIYNDKDKVIQVLSLGKKTPSPQNGNYTSKNSNADDEQTENKEKMEATQSLVPSVAHLSNESVAVLHSSQVAEFQTKQNSNEATDTLTGLSHGATENLHREQVKEYHDKDTKIQK